MQNLEHPSLKPFEPPLRSIHYDVFQRGIEALEKEQLLRRKEDLIGAIKDASVMRRFIRGCHYGFELAQRHIGALVIEYETEIKRTKEALKESRSKRRLADAQLLFSTIEGLELRQLVLRRLADSILFHLIKSQTWVLRRFIAELRIRGIDPTVLKATLDTASEMNRNDRLSFNLVCDLTTVVHIGDLVQISFRGKDRDWKIIELKAGKMNEQLAGIIDERGGN